MQKLESINNLPFQTMEKEQLRLLTGGSTDPVPIEIGEFTGGGEVCMQGQCIQYAEDWKQGKKTELWAWRIVDKPC